MREHTNGLSRRAFIGGAVMLGAASIVAPTTAFAATAAEKQAEADAVRNQLVGLQADLEAAADSYKQALDAQEVAQAAMEAEQVKIDEANGKIADLQDKLGTRARSMYRSGSSNFLDFVMGATSFEEFTQNWDLLNKMNENDGQMVDETKTLREELQASKDEYARQEKIAADKAAEAKVIQTEAEAKVAQATELVNSLDAEAQALLAEEQAAAARAAAEQAAAEEAARQAQNNNNGYNAPSSNSNNTYVPPVYNNGGGGGGGWRLRGQLRLRRGLRHEPHRLPVRMGRRRPERVRLFRARALGVPAGGRLAPPLHRVAVRLREEPRAHFRGAPGRRAVPPRPRGHRGELRRVALCARPHLQRVRARHRSAVVGAVHERAAVLGRTVSTWFRKEGLGPSFCIIGALHSPRKEHAA